jgi:4-amino-4-deoxy-L-arabinose transferase-like glycosyltransferase
VWRYFLSLALCATLLFLVGLEYRHLWGSDEPRVAGIAAEMGRSGDMVVPRLNGEPFLEKPPLYFWAALTIFNLLGENTYTARLPSALAAICGVALVFFLAWSMGFSALTAFISAFILATSTGYWGIGRKCIIDMMLCLFTTCAVLCFFQTRRSLQRRMLWSTGFVLSLSCAVMTKGLVGLAIPLSALSVWLLLEKDFSLRAWGLLSIGSLLCLIPVGIWIWFLYNTLGWDAVYEVVWTNNFARFTGTHQSHIKAFYFYIIRFPKNFSPWVLFLPLALIFHLRKIRAWNMHSSSLFFVAWLGIPFILLSLSAGKRDLYLLPLYPAAALLVGTAVGSILEDEKTPTKWFSVPSAILAGAIILVSLSFGGISIYFKQPFSIWLLVSLPGLFLGIWACKQLTGKDLAGFFKVLVAALVVLYLTFDIGISPLSNQRNSYEPLFNYLETLRSGGAQISLFRPSERIRGAAVFYTKRAIPVIKEEKSLKNFLHSEKRAVAISRNTEVQGIEGIKILKNFDIDRRTIVLVRDNDLD